MVDDDDRIRTLLSRFLREHGFVVATAKDGRDALAVLKQAVFDALVVDVMMPEMNGYEFTRELRGFSRLPVILLTALGEVDNRIEGLEAGADDYLAKPFEPKELLLRLQAILRRSDTAAAQRKQGSITIGQWQYEFGSDVLTSVDGAIVKLTTVEAKLLEILARHAGKILSRDELAHLCGMDGNDRTIDVQITRLRKKVEADTRIPRHIQTIRGQGYLLRAGDV